MSTNIKNLIVNGSKRFMDTISLPAPYPEADIGIYERGAVLSVEMYLPNIEKDSLEIFTSNERLTIKGFYKALGKTFKQVIRLPQKIRREEVYAEFARGILEITLPKAC